MLTKKILAEYKKKSPAKFKIKFGELDPETLEGIIGQTELTEAEMEQGKKPKPIWKEYSLAEIREMGGVEVEPAPLLPQFTPAGAQALAAMMAQAVPAKKETKKKDE